VARQLARHIQSVRFHTRLEDAALRSFVRRSQAKRAGGGDLGAPPAAKSFLR
jgi:hypothetical protein